MRIIRSLLVIIIIVGLVPACGNNDPQEYSLLGRSIINGEPDNRLSHMAVVAVFNGWGLCSGTLISKRVVMTAGHCVENVNPANFLVLFGSDTGAAFSRRVAEASLHTNYDPGGGQTPAFDIALLLLSSSPPPGISPIPHLPNTMALTDADLGSPLDFVGFGQDENGTTGFKLSVVNDLDFICLDAGGCAFGFHPAQRYTICYDQSPGGPCSGDSGGPAIIVRNSKEYVAGITSYGSEGCLVYGCSTKVDEFTSYINDFIAGRLGEDCSQNEDCRSNHCANDVCCEDACLDSCKSCALPGSAGNCQAVPDGTPCPDGDKCNGNEICDSEGVCQPGEDLVCADSNVCSSDSCFPASGCVFNQVPNGTPCDNDNMCDGRETCDFGYCASGEIPDCDDQNPCTTDSCDQQQGCVNVVLADGTPCGDGNCGSKECQAGECVTSELQSCDDLDPCTRDECDPDVGCINEPWPDGMKCGECLVCENQRCVDDPDCARAGGCSCNATSQAASKSWLLFGLLVLFVFRTYLHD
ncbi:MAG: trypsin-like serine protease [Deltaproteobacteria bacterium]|nr:trypsin-like serine protease [Deltaproteobacteria bacterium]